MNFFLDPPSQPLKVIPPAAPLYSKQLIPAADAVLFEGDFGRIMRQQVCFDILTIWYDLLFIEKGFSLHPQVRRPVLTMYYMLGNAILAHLEEAEVQLSEGQFRLVALVRGNHDVVFRPGSYIVFSMEVHNVFLQDLLQEYPELAQAVNRNGRQQSFIGDNVTIPLQAHILLHDIIKSRGRGPKARVKMELQAKQLLLLSLEVLNAGYKKQVQPLVYRDKELLYNVHAYILNNLDKKLTVEVLSHQFGTNTTRLKEGFRQLFNTGFQEFVAKQRLEKARLLLQTDIPVSEVARRVGYTEPSNFIRAFKRHTGVTPVAYKAFPFSG